MPKKLYSASPSLPITGIIGSQVVRMLEDVPSPIDLRVMRDALEWESSAQSKRPYRVQFFAKFVSLIQGMSPLPERMLELGSGPGFLAEYLLKNVNLSTYVALDFSSAMHQLAQRRLGPRAAQVQFIERDFRDDDWADGLGQFTCVVTYQAVHELRHKRHAMRLHAQVKALLLPGAPYLVCDHFAGVDGMAHDQLFMTIEEQRTALLTVGFSTVEQLLLHGGLVLHRAT